MLATGGLDRTGALWSLHGCCADRGAAHGPIGLVTQATSARRRHLLTAVKAWWCRGACVGGGQRVPARRCRATVAIDSARGLVAAGGRDRPSACGAWAPASRSRPLTSASAWVHHLAFRPDGRVLTVTVDHAKGDLEQATGRESRAPFRRCDDGRDVGKPIVFDNGDPISVAWAPMAGVSRS